MESCRIGFREVEIKDQQVLINGRPVLFKGVNRHEHNPETGHTISLEQMIEEIIPTRNVVIMRCPDSVDVMALHLHELEKREEIYWNIDFRQGGLGGNSAGPRPMEKYQLKPEPVKFIVFLEPTGF